MRNKENKRPSSGKGSAGRGRSAGTGKSAFRDSSSPKRGRSDGKPSFDRSSGKSKDNTAPAYSRRNKPFSTGKDSSSFVPHQRSGGRPSDQGNDFRTSGRGPSKYQGQSERNDSRGSFDKESSKYIRREKPFSDERGSSSSLPRNDRPYGRGASSGASENRQKKYVSHDRSFSSDRANSVPRDQTDRPSERRESSGSSGSGPKKYVRREKPDSPDRDSSSHRERNDGPYEGRESSGSSDSGPKKYVRREKPDSPDRDSSSHRERNDRPYERRESSGSSGSGPKKYIRREKPYSSDKDSSAHRERSDRPYERRESSGSSDSGPKKYIRREKPYSLDGDNKPPSGHKDSSYERQKSAGSDDSGPKKYVRREKPFSSDRDSSIPRRERPAQEPRKPILDLREEKLKASGALKDETASGERPERLSREEISTPKYSRRSESETIRLNKFIANAGICSRREADELIKAGVIKVNGVFVTEMGIRVGPKDKVQYGDQTLTGERMVYVLLNKPKGYLTTSDDPFDRKTVMELVADACRERIYPVGRLDRNTTGLLLLTNDGDMAKKLTHPRHKIKKIYHVELDKALTKSDMIRISEGVELEDGVIKADEIAYTGEGKKEIGIELHSGKNRVVRRIFELLEYDVVKLDRVSFAGLTKKDLPRGRWRFLAESEVNYLKMLR